MKKFLLGTLFSGQELNIVDQQNICLTIPFSKPDQHIVLDRVDELIGEPLAREGHHLLVSFSFNRLLADRLHQVRLSQTYPSVDKKRVIGFSRRLRNREGGCVRKLITRSHDKR